MELTKEQQVEEIRESLGDAVSKYGYSLTWDILLKYCPQILIEDRNQELPKEPEFYEDWGGQSGKQGYISGQQDMLRAGWRKVIRVNDANTKD